MVDYQPHDEEIEDSTVELGLYQQHGGEIEGSMVGLGHCQPHDKEIEGSMVVMVINISHPHYG
jgi:hypothetical protein